jgi:hypothetical protein
MERIPKIVSVSPDGPAELVVTFDNGIRKRYDCSPLFIRPEFALIRNPAFFRAVRVDPGGYGVSWSDDIDLSEYELWVRGTGIVSQEAPAEAVQG